MPERSRAFPGMLFLIALAGMRCFVTGANGLPGNADEPGLVAASELMKADEILIGTMGATTPRGPSVFQRDEYPVQVNVFEASVAVKCSLRGERLQHVRITNLFTAMNPAEYLRCQIPERDKIYVFFLKGTNRGDSFTVASPSRFALEIEKIPDGISSDLKASLGNVARLNIDITTNESMAESWAEMLRGNFDSTNDFAFWTNKLTDGRMSIRGIAMLTLAENAPETPSLYPRVLSFLADETEGPNMLFTGQALLKLLPRLAGKDGPSINDLKNWLVTKSKGVKIMALRYITTKRQTGLMPDIAVLLTESEDREVQYECNKALDSLDNRPVISYPHFMEHADEYIQEWQEITKSTN